MKLQNLQKEIMGLRSGSHAEAQFSTEILVRKNQVRVFQNNRLSRTYKDLLESDQMSRAAGFFLNHLYGLEGLDKRDQQVARVLPKAERILPQAAVNVLEKVLELDLLSEKLDVEMSVLLEAQGVCLSEPLDDAVYIEAFASSGGRALREEQLKTLLAAGTSLSKLLRLPMLAGILKMTRGAAQKANLEDFHQFLSEGAASFKSLKSPSEFLSIIQRRETELLERIYSGRLKHFDEYPSLS